MYGASAAVDAGAAAGLRKRATCFTRVMLCSRTVHPQLQQPALVALPSTPVGLIQYVPISELPETRETTRLAYPTCEKFRVHVPVFLPFFQRRKDQDNPKTKDDKTKHKTD